MIQQQSVTKIHSQEEHSMDSQPTVTRPLHKSSDFVSDVVPKKVPTKKSLADIASVEWHLIKPK